MGLAQHVLSGEAVGSRLDYWKSLSECLAYASGCRPAIRSAAFSAIMIVDAAVLPLTIAGMIEGIDHSQTRHSLNS